MAEFVAQIRRLEKSIRDQRRKLRRQEKLPASSREEKLEIQQALNRDYEAYHILQQDWRRAKRDYLRKVSESSRLFEEWKNVAKPLMDQKTQRILNASTTPAEKIYEHS